MAGDARDVDIRDLPESETEDEVEFWNFNIPKKDRTKDCPDFLEYCFQNEKDRKILSTLDKDYHIQTWDDVSWMIRDNRIDLFQRVPSDLRRYREYSAKLIKDHGSIMSFVMKERLKWDDLTPKGKPFAEASDMKCLKNDWPYGLSPGIVHLIVWTKFELTSDPETDDLTPEMRKQIDGYVTKTFASRCGKENTLWFKNWSSLKSIHAVEHLHVMLRDPDPKFVEEITGGDVALADLVGKPAPPKPNDGDQREVV